MVGTARCAVPARVVAGGTNIRATMAFEGVAPLHAARTSQRDVPTTLNTYLAGRSFCHESSHYAGEMPAARSHLTKGSLAAVRSVCNLFSKPLIRANNTKTKKTAAFPVPTSLA